MILVTDYTTYNDIRAVLGVSEYEITDYMLSLGTYASTLQRALRTTADDSSKSLYAYYDELSVIVSPTEAQEELLNLIKDVSTYTVAEACLSGLSLLALKSESDGKATQTRFSAESTFLTVSSNIKNTLLSIKNEILNTIGVSTTYNPISLVNRVEPDADPVTE